MPKPKIITDDEGVEIELPTCWEICPECNGEGKHSHAVDGNGITSSEWEEWDDEDREFYFRGGYDKICEVCHGSGKIAVVDTEHLSPEHAELWAAYQQDLAEAEAYERMERRMGA